MLIGKPQSAGIAGLDAVLLIGAVLAAVHHAETIAHAVGEPFGSLVLALAVTVIETSLIASVMITEGSGAAALARDTVFATMMIVLNGIVGLCLLIGGRKHHEQSFTQFGVSAALAMLSTLAVLVLVLPNYTTTASGPFYSRSQLVFVAIISLVIYASFVFAQTIRHQDYFLHDNGAERSDHKIRPVTAWASFVVMLVALVAVVLLAKSLSPVMKQVVAAAGAPPAMVGIIIAAVVLLPEAIAAVAAARRDDLQTSLNLALGSALATTGLTIPAVATVSLLLGLDLILGLPLRETILLALTLFVTSLSLGTGRTTLVHGVIHLVLFATFLFTTLVP